MDTNNLTEQQLKTGYWFVTHKLILKKILAGALIALNAGLWLFTLYHAVRLVFIDGPKHRADLRQLSLNLVNPEALQGARAHDLEFGEPLIFSTGADRYDLAVKATNPNQSFYTRFRYRFVGEGFETPEQRGVLAPQGTAVLTVLGFESAENIRSGRLEFTSFEWHRISKHDVPDPAAYVRERAAFEIKDAAFRPGSPARATFTIANRTAYGYWSVEAMVLAKRGGQIVGVNKAVLERLRSGEERQVELTWFDTISGASSIEVIPVVDIFNPSSYLPPER